MELARFNKFLSNSFVGLKHQEKLFARVGKLHIRDVPNPNGESK